MKKIFAFMLALLPLAAVSFTSCNNGEEDPAPYELVDAQPITLNGSEVIIGTQGNPFSYWSAVTTDDDGTDYYNLGQIGFTTDTDLTGKSLVTYYMFDFITEVEPTPGVDLTKTSIVLTSYPARNTSAVTAAQYTSGAINVLAVDKTNHSITVQFEEAVFGSYSFNGTVTLPFWIN